MCQTFFRQKNFLRNLGDAPQLPPLIFPCFCIAVKSWKKKLQKLRLKGNQSHVSVLRKDTCNVSES